MVEKISRQVILLFLPPYLTQSRGVLLRDPRRYKMTGEVQLCTDGSKHISIKFLYNQSCLQNKANDLPDLDVLGTAQ